TGPARHAHQGRHRLPRGAARKAAPQHRQLNAPVSANPFTRAGPRMLQLRLLIDNRWCDAEGARTFTVVNPATGEPIAEAAEASAADAGRAVEAARAAFERGTWSDMDPDDRAEILLRVASLLKERQAEFARL